MKEISLTQGKVTLVDDADYDRLMLFKWHAKKGGRPEYDDPAKQRWYAYRAEQINRTAMRGMKSSKGKKRPKRKQIAMHNAIMKPPEGLTSHHIDSNGLNNQRYNLEVCTQEINNQHAGEKRKQNKENPPDDIPI